MAPAADYLILKRRAQEEERMKYERVTRDNFKAASNAEWEIRTQGFIDHHTTNQRYETLRMADKVLLEMRQRKLADMLAAEAASFQAQLQALAESPGERKTRMESRASELKEKRETEVRSHCMMHPRRAYVLTFDEIPYRVFPAQRLAFVRQQYERQWRMACDPLREKESKEILKATNAARAFQIGEKMKALELDEQESRAFDEIWEKDRLAKLGREEAEEDARRQMDLEHKLVLDQQVAELHSFRENEKCQAEGVALLLREQWELEREEAKRVEMMRQEVRSGTNPSSATAPGTTAPMTLCSGADAS